MVDIPRTVHQVHRVHPVHRSYREDRAIPVSGLLVSAETWAVERSRLPNPQRGEDSAIAEKERRGADDAGHAPSAGADGVALDGSAVLETKS